MASSYTTGFSLEKIATGEQAGTWGTTENHNWDIVDRLASYKAVALSDASTATLTVREASPGSGTENLQDGMYRAIKFTGSLSQDCTVTIAPNTAPAWFIIENAAGDDIILSQGTGADVTVQNGKNVLVYCDGAGGGAAVVDALADLQIGTLEVTGAAAIDGAATLGSTLGVTGAITASGGVAATGNVTATGTVEPAGDTTSSDNAAIGYTAAEGLILTGQGSTSDVTVKNDADGTVLSVLTGSTTVNVPGTLTAGTDSSGNSAHRVQSGGTAYKMNGDTASQLSTITWINNTGTTVANIWKTGDAATSAPLRINSLGTIQLRPREVGIDGDAPVAEISGVVNTNGLLQVTGTVLATTSTAGGQGGSTTLDFAANQNFVLTLTSNITLANPTTEQVGQSGIICFIQDADGGNTLSLGTDYETAGGAGITLSTAGNAVDIIPYFVKASGSIQLGAVQLAFS